jgi:nicotinate-nucleotide pyrophosphorylase (carboxylating)
VEADTLEQVRQAVEAGADIILLDNMSPDTIRQALGIIQKRAIAEASGGISLDTIRAYAETGVDVISTSKITLGVPAIDVGLDLE